MPVDRTKHARRPVCSNTARLENIPASSCSYNVSCYAGRPAGQSVSLDRPSHTQSNICFGKITSVALRVGRQAGREHCYGRVIIATKGNGHKEHETVFSEIYFALWMEYLMTYQSARDCTGLQRCTLPYQQFVLLLQRHDILEAINNL